MQTATWNLERKKPTSTRGSEAVDYLYERNAEVMVLTEARTTFPARHGHLLCGEPSPASWFAEDERKVAIWSANELEPVAFESTIDPSRFVAARTDTSIGRILLLGVCIPWHMAEVTHRSGPRRKPWEMHVLFLEQLKVLMDSLDEPFIVAGDFNQRYPRAARANRAAADALEATFERLVIATAGTVDGCTKPGIDHIALSHHVRATDVVGWANDVTGNRLSDHDGVMVDLASGE